MKKFKIAIGCIAMALATSGAVACTAPNDNGDGVKYTVTFQNPWGGVSEETVDKGGVVMRPEDPERPGYTFDGWYLNGVEYTFDGAVTGDITLVARYTSVLGGEGTASDPFTIDNAEELALVKKYIADGVSGFASAHYKQTADITSSLTESIPEFSGTYDGGGHKIILIEPLFEKLTGIVRNLDVSGVKVADGNVPVGLLAAVAENATISRVTAVGNISCFVGKKLSGTVGGIVGEQRGGRIEYSESRVDVSGLVAGGIAGKSTGAVVNCVAESTVLGGTYAGGAVGELGEGGLVQNVGAGEPSGAINGKSAQFVVCYDGTAGGVVGKKHIRSAVYRAFVYGSSVQGKRAGAVVGVVDADTPVHSEIVDCTVLSSVDINGALTEADYAGVYTADDFSDVTLPAAIWDATGEIPALKAEIGKLPDTVVMTVNGNATSVEYGFKANRELFTVCDEHYSSLIETDTNVELKTVARLHTNFAGSEFNAGNYGLRLAASGAKYRIGSAEYKDLDYVLTYAHTEQYFYFRDYNEQDKGEYVDYDAPVSVYTDGKDYYAFTVAKQYVGSNMYMGFLEAYKLGDDGWTHYKSFAPKSDYSSGAYKYSANILGSVMTYMFIIDDEYIVTPSGDGGYYNTRYVLRVYDGDEYTESREVIGRGETVMFLGNTPGDEYTTVFSYEVDYDGTVNFFYRDESSGRLISSEGIALEDATADFLVGTWYDGANKFVFDAENGTVAVTGENGTATESFTVQNGRIKFTHAGKTHELKFVPGTLGSYVLEDTADGGALVLATYIDNALDGTWITENGETVTVSSDPAASVTFGGETATDVHDDVYNGMQALCFTAGGKEYRLVTYTDKNVTVLVYGDVATYAFDKEMLLKDYAGAFSAFSNASRIDMTVGDDLTLTYGNYNAVALVPEKISDGLTVEYVMTASVKVGASTEEYVLKRVNDVVTVTAPSGENVFTDSEILDRFVVTYTNGTEILEVDASGFFYRYAKDGEKGNTVALTSGYREERYEYGLENRGFVLYYESGDDTMFFYADTDAENVRLYRAWVNSVGNDTATLITNFVPESYIEPLAGEYTRTYNNEPDTLTFGTDGSLKRTYLDEKGVKHTDEAIVWYPVINYNSNTQNKWVIAYTHTVDDGAGFTTRIDFELTGLSWGFNTYLNNSSAASAIGEFLDIFFASDDNRVLTVSSNQISIRSFTFENNYYNAPSLTYNFADISVTGINTVSINLEASFLTETDNAVAVLDKNGDLYSVTLTVNNGEPQVFNSKKKLDYNELVGDYSKDGVTYKFTVDSSWMGTSISLKIGTTNYTYSESRGITLMSDGTQALTLSRGSSTFKFVWKNDKGSLMVCDSLDATQAIEVEDASLANMPSIEKLYELLDGQEFTASDNSVLTFEYGNGFGGSYFCAVIDGGDELYLETYRKEVGKYVLFLESDNNESCCVIVNMNDDKVVTKVNVGTTEDKAKKEYLPEYVPPTSAEIKAMLAETYMSVDNKFIMFSKDFGFSVRIGSAIYNYESASYENGKYVFDFTTGRKNISLYIEFDENGIIKITVDNVDYTEFTAPAIETVLHGLSGKTYSAGENESIVFDEYPSGIYYMNIVGDPDNVEYDYDPEESEATLAANIYTVYMYDDSGNANYKILTVTLNADGSVQKITMDGKDYTLAATQA